MFQYSIVIALFAFQHCFCYLLVYARADWTAWLPCTYQVGLLVRRPGGPPHQILKEGVELRRGPGALSWGGCTGIKYLQGPGFI